MKVPYKFFFVFILLVSCNDQTSKVKGKVVNDNYRPVYSSKQISEEIELAFNNREPVLIENIFSEWHSTVKPNSQEFINQNEVTRAIFDVFDSFYRPDDLSKMGNWACTDEINLRCKYVVIQNRITYSVVKSKNINEFDESMATKHLISNFRPPVDFGNALYLTNEYEESIYSFLEKELNNGFGEWSEKSLLKNKENEKVEALKNYIPVLRDYWGHNWQLGTYPFIDLIIFNKSITKAKIEFYVGYQSGRAQMERKGNRWFVKNTEIIL